MSDLDWYRDWDVIVADERYDAYERDADRIEDARREHDDEDAPNENEDA